MYWVITSVYKVCFWFSSNLDKSPLANFNSSNVSLYIFCLEISTNGTKWDKEIDWPPYCELATCAIICVAILQAVENEWGLSIIVSLITVPFISISFKFTKSQLWIWLAK